ncbi:probable DNA-directed RNA polymerase I subunit RPA43 [Vigna unguiculata]|uniref:DNA-directed RNA polymerase subunit n=1 Tax=Vigna unguiculata TaxID=3917 RepID=A0A4D6NIM1_VIGUN|nr:probable DNA-directed RNA polymerase I subunit RPA43 [Vigna unguiculata]XP_027925936.1 probable DNA-directed RNA polymerase I subunit RPA43 [Vigna unguiculata]QCE12439.1 DNA-directed RNA polymerase I subunit RPA43 [Vigna unguiculata]
MEGLKVSKANLTVYIHPSKSNQVSQAVLRELSSLLFTFSEIVDGVVLAYDVNSLDTCAKILPGVHPYFGVKLKVNFLLFSPKPNTLLEGKVVKLTQESIHVVVLGFSAAVIAEKDIREEFVWKMKKGQEVYASRSNKRHVIKVGTMIRFSVKSFDEEILHVYGSLIPEHTGSIYWLDKNLEVVSHADRSEKKKRIQPERIVLEQDVVDGELSTLDIAQKKTSAKRQKHSEDS